MSTLNLFLIFDGLWFKGIMMEATRSKSRVLFEEKDETFINKGNLKTKNLSRMGEFISPEAIQLKAKFAIANLMWLNVYQLLDFTLTPSQNFLTENFTLPQGEGDEPVSLTSVFIKGTRYLLIFYKMKFWLRKATTPSDAIPVASSFRRKGRSVYQQGKFKN